MQMRESLDNLLHRNPAGHLRQQRADAMVKSMAKG
jgi:hypothetical protein